MDQQGPLLLLSSGAKPRYLEDIVRAVALPNSCELRFRYDEPYPSPAVWAAVRDKPGGAQSLVGRKAYIAYLDNRIPDKTPTFVPVREATITDARDNGGALIIDMRLESYFDLGKVGDGQLDSLTREIELKAQNQLPKWKPQPRDPNDPYPFTGHWVNFLSGRVASDRLVPHDAAGRTHLAKVSNTAKHLCTHSDFDDYDKSLFFNIIGLENSSKKFLPIKDGAWSVRPSKMYKLSMSHIRPNESTHPTDTRLMYFGTHVFGDSIELSGVGLLVADNDYDEKTLTIVAKEKLRSSRSTLTLYRTKDPKIEHETSADVSLSFVVKPSIPALAIQWLVIAIGISGPAYVAAWARLPVGQTLPAWEVVAIGAFGVAAAIASVFGLRRSV